MLNQFGQQLAEAMFDAGISSYSELLECLWEAGADPEVASATALVKALVSTKVDDRPDFSPDFWGVLCSPRVLDLSADEGKTLMRVYLMSEAEIHRVYHQRGG
jgi:hypothetical protein